MNRLDFTPFRRSMVGFDHIFDMLENQQRNGQTDNYPPFNLEKIGDETFRISIAVAGFRKNDLEIIAQQNLLIVQGKKPEHTLKNEFLHVGIAQRAFERRFELADHMLVTHAHLEDGLLVIDLVREVPEAMKPRRIAISNEGNAALHSTQ